MPSEEQAKKVPKIFPTNEIARNKICSADKWFKDILPDKDPYHNRGRDQMRKKGGPEFECLCSHLLKREGQILDNFKTFLSIKSH